MKKEKRYLLLGALALTLVFAVTGCENPAGPGTEDPPVNQDPINQDPITQDPITEGPPPETDPDVLFWDALTTWHSFDTLADMGAFLETAAANTAATPYAIKLGAEVDIADFSKGPGASNDKLGYLFEAFHGKYVALDLSACAADIIENNNAAATNGRTDPDKLVGIILPESLEKIGNYIFYDDIAAGPASSLVSVILPAGLTQIGSYAFHGAALRTISLPASIIKLGLMAARASPSRTACRLLP